MVKLVMMIAKLMNGKKIDRTNSFNTPNKKSSNQNLNMSMTCKDTDDIIIDHLQYESQYRLMATNTYYYQLLLTQSDLFYQRAVMYENHKDDDLETILRVACER